MIQNDKWGIDSSIYSIDFTEGENTKIFLNGYFSLRNNEKINLTYTKLNSSIKFKLLNDSEKNFVKLNNYNNNNHIFSLKYSFYKSKYKYNIIFQNRLLDLYTSVRIWPSRVNSNLNILFNLVPIVINNSTAYLKQNLYSIRIIKLGGIFFSPYLQIDWIKDKYDVILNTKSLSIFGFPIPDYSNNQELNIIGKDAFNLLFGTKIIKDDWLFIASVSQHIPYKLYTIETIELNNIKQTNDLYGGGKFDFTIIKYFE